MPLRLLPALLLWLTTAQAGMYRWVDENGVTVYSQTPPPQGVTAQRLAVPKPPPAQTGPNPIDRQLQKFRDRRELKQIARERQAKTEQIQARRQRDCDAARHNLAILQGPARARVRTPDGTVRRLTPEERQAQIDEANRRIEQHCADK